MDPDRWDPHACSVLGDALGESAYGTASFASGWFALEQPGPWGRDAVGDSHLDSELGRSFAARASEAGGRFVLVRTTGRHADDHHGGLRRLMVSSTTAGREWLLQGSLSELDDLRRLDVEAVARGDLEATRASMPVLEPSREPVFLVCTNGRRDVCCAVRGRPVAQAAGAARPRQVWETSHTGGHRFAPTGVMLPSGITLARLTSTDVVAALDSAVIGELPRHLTGPRHDRGRSALSPVEQAAESEVRHRCGEVRVAALSTLHAEDREGVAHVTVKRIDEDGSTTETSVLVRRVRRSPDRPVSCGKPYELQERYAVEVIDAPLG
jgi:hypothetical protein